jgi:hypothetical protein
VCHTLLASTQMDCALHVLYYGWRHPVPHRTSFFEETVSSKTFFSGSGSHVHTVLEASPSLLMLPVPLSMQCICMQVGPSAQTHLLAAASLG